MVIDFIGSVDTPRPKGPYWKKCISKFSKIAGKYKSCWPKREKCVTLWACEPVVSSVWACYMVYSNMITWQKVRVVLWSLERKRLRTPPPSFFCWYFISERGRCAGSHHSSLKTTGHSDYKCNDRTWVEWKLSFLFPESKKVISAVSLWSFHQEKVSPEPRSSSAILRESTSWKSAC